MKKSKQSREDNFTEDDELVSLIIPVYNVKKWLARCLKSVLAQTYRNLEIILVDDGSTDGSGELCEECTKKNGKDKKIVVIHQENQGLSAARNAGLKVARGKYVIFIDSDDTVEPQIVEKLYKQAVLNQAEIVLAPLNEIYNDGRKKSDILGNRIITLTAKECLQNLLLDRGITLSAAGKLFKKELFRGVQFPVGKLYEDVGTTYKLVLECKKIVYVPEALYNYYQNSDSIVHQKFQLAKMDLISQVDEMCRVIVNKYPDLENATKKRRMQARFSILRQLMDDNKHSDVRVEIVGYLKKQKDDILKNPLADRRDKIAMITLLLGLPVFRVAWKIYALKNR